MQQQYIYGLLQGNFAYKSPKFYRLQKFPAATLVTVAEFAAPSRASHDQIGFHSKS